MSTNNPNNPNRRDLISSPSTASLNWNTSQASDMTDKFSDPCIGDFRGYNKGENCKFIPHNDPATKYFCIWCTRDWEFPSSYDYRWWA